MIEQASLFEWTPGKGRDKCRRDLSAGPGSCWWWWEGCPKAEKRECYFKSEAWRLRLAAAEAERDAAHRNPPKRPRGSKGGAS